MQRHKDYRNNYAHDLGLVRAREGRLVHVIVLVGIARAVVPDVFGGTGNDTTLGGPGRDSFEGDGAGPARRGEGRGARLGGPGHDPGAELLQRQPRPAVGVGGDRTSATYACALAPSTKPRTSAAGSL